MLDKLTDDALISIFTFAYDSKSWNDFAKFTGQVAPVCRKLHAFTHSRAWLESFHHALAPVPRGVTPSRYPLRKPIHKTKGLYASVRSKFITKQIQRHARYKDERVGQTDIEKEERGLGVMNKLKHLITTNKRVRDLYGHRLPRLRIEIPRSASIIKSMRKRAEMHRGYLKWKTFRENLKK